VKLGFEEEQTPFVSPSQSARFWTERWVSLQAFCPNCGFVRITRYENNRPVADFYCSSCREEFELKSQKTKFGPKVVDGAYRTMCERLSSNQNPNLMLMNYDVKSLSVKDLCVVPKHFFTPNIIQERRPLAATAKRAGWIGCNILIGLIPDAGRIFLVRDGQPVEREAVLEKWRQTLFLREERPEARGWLIEVLKCVEATGKSHFELADIYFFETHLSEIYPNNRHIKQKIRQQLQILRDNGIIEFLSRGRYRIRAEL
jgi:type II restriction enzyme